MSGVASLIVNGPSLWFSMPWPWGPYCHNNWDKGPADLNVEIWSVGLQSHRFSPFTEWFRVFMTQVGKEPWLYIYPGNRRKCW